MIHLSHVYKTYDNATPALVDVSLTIEKGEFVYLTGPSGAGKTTLFRLITCFERPTTGSIIVAGYNLATVTAAEIPFVRRKIGVVFQDFKLLGNRTVFENVALPLEILDQKRSEIQARVSDMLDQVGLKYKATFYPQQLSGGEQQRVAIARSLVSRPGILIADEPTGNLDQDLSEGIMELFSTINAQGTTVFVATHNQKLISQGRRRVVKIEKGSVVDSGDRVWTPTNEPFLDDVVST